MTGTVFGCMYTEEVAIFAQEEMDRRESRHLGKSCGLVHCCDCDCTMQRHWELVMVFVLLLRLSHQKKSPGYLFSTSCECRKQTGVERPASKDSTTAVTRLEMAMDVFKLVRECSQLSSILCLSVLVRISTASLHQEPQV